MLHAMVPGHVVSPGEEVAEMCFTGIASQLGGLGFEQIALRTLSVHDRGFSPDGGYTVTRPYFNS